MSELVPSVLLYGQAVELLNELQEAQATGAIKDTFDLVRKFADILTKFEDDAGKPFLRYEPVAETEPPSSEKSNRFWRAAEQDISLLQQQVDILRAAAIFSHNLVSTDVMSAQAGNARLGNKLKTLQLYSNASDSSIITFGDSFKSFEFVDLDTVAESERAALFHEGYVTLGQEGEMLNLSDGATIKILDGSNGFLGNNQEIEDPSQAPTDTESGAAQYTFKAEVRNYSDLRSIIDAEPNTWIEYERYSLSSSQKRSAANYNFTYMQTLEDGTVERVDWATAPEAGILRLGIEFDFGIIKNLNSVELTPYGLEGNSNYPVLIKEVQTSPNGTDWTSVYPGNVWVGTDINLRTARAADTVIMNRALWAFESRAARYVRVYVEQHHPVDSNIGHVYWVDRRSTDKRRTEGPNPPVEEPTKYLPQMVVGDYLQRREYFRGKRWAIGLRDVLVQQVEYTDKSILVTKPLRVGGIIDRVMLEQADIQVPEEYNPNESWVKFFITPDEGQNWYPIARIADNYQGIPEQISFNDPLHESLREVTIKNYNLDRPVTSLRLKVELSRPAEYKSTTPVLRSYVLKVKRR